VIVEGANHIGDQMPDAVDVCRRPVRNPEARDDEPFGGNHHDVLPEQAARKERIAGSARYAPRH